MRLADGFFWVARSVLSQRQRSILTALGIAIGIAAVSLLTSVGEGLRVYLLNQFSSFGTRLITVTPGKVSTQGMAGMLKTVRPLSLRDAEALQNLPYINALTPVITGTVKVDAGDRQRDTSVAGVGPQLPIAWNMRVALGRFLPQDDGIERPYVVLGHKVRTELFGDRNPLGALVRVGGSRFRVIGVMESKGQMLGFDLDDIVYIPVNRGLQLMNREGLGEIDIAFSEQTTSAEMAKRVKRVMIGLHGEEDFTLFTQEDMLASLDRILRFITLAIAGLGGISLITGGVGVATIMTTALRERMSEIGLLRALGATREQTLLLFLGEAIVLASIGGISGILIIVILVGVGRLAVDGLPVALEPFYLLMAFLLSTAVGLIAGIMPAWRASKLDPIEALRQE
ncbi:MAG: peptide transporter permease [Verrucomicrobiaceae bacterium]|nr:peptide transporter permease [Verrucomicrobiaceae bacterium]